MNSSLPERVRNGLLLGVVIALTLVVSGHFAVPTTSFRSIAAASAILIAYGLMAWFLPILLYRLHPDVLRFGGAFGVLAGAVFAGEIILEYLLLPRNNTQYGLVEFGVVFLIYSTSAFVVAYRFGTIKRAVCAAMTTAFIASLFWNIVLFATFYAFRGSHRQEMVMRAEGNYDDFTRSGMTDFAAFVIEDLMGATFFHLLLGLVVGAVLGLLGGLLGRVCAKVRFAPCAGARTDQ